MKGLLITLTIVLGGLLAFSFFRRSSDDTRADYGIQETINDTQQEAEPTPQIEPIPHEVVTKTSQEASADDLIIREIDAEITKSSTPLPRTVNHEMTFFAQAPDGDRSLPRKEACEEASIILAAYFAQGKSLTKEQFKQDVRAMVPVQEEMFGTYIDTTIKQTQQLYERFYGGSSYIIDNPTVTDIKTAIANEHVIVAPFAGRELNNPHFSGEGPRYHMLVIKGYDEQYFYTNDVGTRNGANYRYTHAVLLNALHDLTDGDINQ